MIKKLCALPTPSPLIITGGPESAQKNRLLDLAKQAWSWATPASCLEKMFYIDDFNIRIGEASALNDPGTEIVLVGTGKASVGMVSACIDILEKNHFKGSVRALAVPKEVPTTPQKFEVIVGDHPTPGANSLAAFQAVKTLLNTPSKTSLTQIIIPLISGGTTSLVAAPKHDSISVTDLSAYFDILHKLELSIDEMNTCRSVVLAYGNGGGVDHLSNPTAQITPFLICDVPSGKAGSIGSGPFYKQLLSARAISILSEHNVLHRTPESIRRYIHLTDEPISKSPPHTLCASNQVVLEHLTQLPPSLHHNLPIHVLKDMPSEANAFAAELLKRADHMQTECLLIWGGELSVNGETFTAEAAGGRLQHMMLTAGLCNTQGHDIMAFATDLGDGVAPTGKQVPAGVYLDADSSEKLRALNPKQHVQEGTSYQLLEQLDAQLFASVPEHLRTNVNDFVFVVTHPK